MHKLRGKGGRLQLLLPILALLLAAVGRCAALCRWRRLAACCRLLAALFLCLGCLLLGLLPGRGKDGGDVL